MRMREILNWHKCAIGVHIELVIEYDGQIHNYQTDRYAFHHDGLERPPLKGNNMMGKLYNVRHCRRHPFVVSLEEQIKKELNTVHFLDIYGVKEFLGYES